MSRRLSIVQLVHSHPSLLSGGTERVAMALHRAALSEGHASLYVGAADGNEVRPHPGTQTIALTPDTSEVLMFSAQFGGFALYQPDTYGMLREFGDLLADRAPDVVHVHHVLQWGLQVLPLIRHRLPQARIVMTLHDFFLACAQHGQLYRHDEARRCEGPRLADCLACVPERRAEDFTMRALDVRHALTYVDRLISPSRFLQGTMVAALGGDHDIAVVPNGCLTDSEPAPPPRDRSPGDPVVFGYFGNLAKLKGFPDLVAAAGHLLRRGISDFRIDCHGAQLFPDPAMDEAMAAAGDLGPVFRFAGRYRTEELSSRMAQVDAVIFPSIWWENAPLVIHEALHHRRNVLAYPHGGAPEILAASGAGLLAARSDPEALADLMAEIIHDPSRLAMPAFSAQQGPLDLWRRHLPIYRDEA